MGFRSQPQGEAEPRTQIGGRLARMGWGGGRAHVSLPPGPHSTPISIPSPWHLAAIIGGADCSPLPLSGKQAQLGPRHICRISTEHSWVCPEPRSPKHEVGGGGQGEHRPLRQTH